MNKTLQERIIQWLPVLSILLLIILCIPFLNNPLIFDDIHFFITGEPEHYIAVGFSPNSRWWVYQSLALTFVYLGEELYWFRIGNLAIHIGTACALFALIRRLLRDLDDNPSSTLRPGMAALIAATLFAFHPLANFTQGYLIQRTILCATLFALVCWYLFWRGLNGSRAALWGSAIAFVLSIYAKEHAVMVPAICFLLLVLYWRSGLALRFKLAEILSALALQGAIALIVVLHVKSKGIMGAAYEVSSVDMLGSLPIQTEHFFSLSVLNQAGLFFKYLFLWIFPDSGSIAIDMQEPFPASFASWSLWAGGLMYVAWGSVAAYLLLQGKRKGLAGLALLSTWVLFFPEFTVVRVYESFVIYRSYLWLPLLFTLFAIGIRHLNEKLAYPACLLVFLFFAWQSFDRLTTLSHPLYAWDEAAELLEKKASKQQVYGGARVYYNRGLALQRLGMLKEAMADYDRAISQSPKFAYPYHQQGLIYMDWKEWYNARISFEKTLALRPQNTISWLMRGEALEKLSDFDQAQKSFLVACHMGNKLGCEKSARQIK